MDPRKLSELDPFLKGSGLSPKKSLSQNFLVDMNVLKKIVKTAEIKPGDSVLEIGPGPGGLTLTLIEAGAEVTAIEIDKNYASKLSETINSPHLKVICEDFLRYTPAKEAIVVANIPYHISTPIIEKLTEHRELFSRIFLTVQKDFAERILTKGKSNAFSIFIDFYFEASIPFTISKDCFYPKPTIASVLLSLKPRKTLPVKDPEAFITFTRLLFQKRRKMIRSILGDPSLTSARPESLQTKDLIQLYLSLKADS